MIEPLGEHNLHEFLSAFADGELDAAQNLAVLDYLQTHAEAFEYLRDRQRLRQSTQRVVLGDKRANEMPAELKARLSQLARDKDDGVPPPGPTGRGGASGIRRWWPRSIGMIAASVAAGLFVGLLWNRTNDPASSKPLAPAPPSIATRTLSAEEIDQRDAAIPVTLLSAATHVHIDCSRVAERLHSGGYPVDLGPLSRLVERDLGTDVAHPDLSSIGYHFVGAGPCARPLEGTVHLLYKMDGPEPRAAISIFAQVYSGQYSLKPGRMYCVASREATFAMVAWRSAGVVYFLIADDFDSAVAAQAAIPSAPARLGV